MATGARWTNKELEACAEAYATMWHKQQKGQSPDRSDAVSKLVRGPLSSRTVGSIRMRMGNIAAIMEEEGRPLLEGYVPLRNVGAVSAVTMRRFLNAKGVI